MRTLIPLAVVAAVALAGAARADDAAVPEKTLAGLKASTVYVKATGERAGGTGSGFVASVDADAGTGLIVTNAHVVLLPKELGALKYEVVFNSGKGGTEKAVEAELVCADPEVDLAVLRVKSKGLPPAIPLTAKAKLTETMTVYPLGFPFGDRLSVGDGNPAVTVGKATVSSLREDKAGKLEAIQIDGSINPGNSGGPVVDGKGQLVGVTVSKIRNTNIAFVIPAAEVREVMAGKVVAMSWKVTEEKGGVEVEFAAVLADPLKKLKGLSVRVAKGAAATPAGGGAAKEPPLLADAQSMALKIDGQLATGKMLLKGAKLGDEYQFQPVYSTAAKADQHWAAATKKLAVSRDPLAGLSGTGPAVTAAPAYTGPKWKAAGGAKPVGDIAVKSLSIAGKLDPKPIPAGQSPRGQPACMFWAADGKAFYALDVSTDTVRKISFPDLKELASAAVGKECWWISPCKGGVLASVTGAQEAWVLDPDTLKKTSSFAVGKALRVVSAPTLDVGYATETDNFATAAILVYDLKAGKLLKKYSNRDLPFSTGYSMPTLSPDGKFMYSCSTDNRLCRYAVDKEKVTETGITDGIISGVLVGPCVSADGVLCCVPSGGGNGAAAGEQRKAYSTNVYDARDLKKPVLVLATGPYPTAVGFDLKAGLIYAHNMDDQLIVMDDAGTVQKSFKLKGENAGGFATVSQFLVHPDGRKLVVLLGHDTVFAVELSAK